MYIASFANHKMKKYYTFTTQCTFRIWMECYNYLITNTQTLQENGLLKERREWGREEKELPFDL